MNEELTCTKWDICVLLYTLEVDTMWDKIQKYMRLWLSLGFTYLLQVKHMEWNIHLQDRS